MQRLTATRSELVHNTDEETWHISIAPKEELLTGKQVKAAREILHLCLLETSLRRPGRTWYKLTKEAVKVLLDAAHVPAFLKTKIRQ